MYTLKTKITDVANDPVFGNYGRLIFPIQEEHLKGETLDELEMTFYNNVDPAMTVEVTNYLHDHAAAGEKVFFDIYTDEEKAADPAKKDTGCFFFKGNPGEKFIICVPGGAFKFIGAIHDGFPVALEVIKRGYNAFCPIYRTRLDGSGPQDSAEDLAKTIAVIFEHAAEFGIDVTDYTIWGSSAGARMAVYLGNAGTEGYGQKAYPKPASIVMQYTGHTEVTDHEPPTYSHVGSVDWVVNWKVMQKRHEELTAKGVPSEFHVYEGVNHGFGIGTGTIADGWIDEAIAFWIAQMK